jgi:hypothetical protein
LGQAGDGEPGEGRGGEGDRQSGSPSFGTVYEKAPAYFPLRRPGEYIRPSWCNLDLGRQPPGSSLLDEQQRAGISSQKVRSWNRMRNQYRRSVWNARAHIGPIRD